jgi:hypothetical protein
MALAMALCTTLGCGSSTPVDGGAPFPPPLQFDAGMRQDAGTTPNADGGDNRTAECIAYCTKLFDCGYFPRPPQPAGYSRASCVMDCSGFGFPSQDRRQCVANASCACDAGTDCTPVSSCFGFGG